MKEVVNVEFKGGELRDGSQGNYMLANIDGIELYAEVEFDENLSESEFDEKSYQILKDEIISQAKENGINIEMLKFWWD